MLISANGRDSSREHHTDVQKPENLAMSEPDSPTKPKDSKKIPWLILLILLLLLLIAGLIIALLAVALRQKAEVCLTPACIHTGNL